jgi:hypothetical protein
MKGTPQTFWVAEGILFSPTIRALVGASLIASLCSLKAAEPERRDLATIKERQASSSPEQVWQWLREGNDRFASGKPESREEFASDKSSPTEKAKGQGE